VGGRRLQTTDYLERLRARVNLAMDHNLEVTINRLGDYVMRLLEIAEMQQDEITQLRSEVKRAAAAAERAERGPYAA
jgi:hypothetical protein